MKSPRIAVILDENTSGDGSRYEASKSYFLAIRNAGGLPFGIPYLPEVIDIVLEEFDGLVCTGGRYAYPDNWYLDGETSNSPQSERLAIEQKIVAGYLQRDKPILGICAGMQLLAGMHGCKLWADLHHSIPGVNEHDASGKRHNVSVTPGTRLLELVGQPTLNVNTFHREAIRSITDTVVVNAQADDGIIEGIEIPSQSFAIGLQWHQEHFAATDHPANAITRGFVDACR